MESLNPNSQEIELHQLQQMQDKTKESSMLLNLDQLEKQLGKEEFQENESMDAFRALKTQFQLLINFQDYFDYFDDGPMIRKFFLAYTQTELPKFRDTLIPHMEYVKKSIDERTQLKRDGTKSDKHDTSSRSGTYITHDVDAYIRPVNDHVPFAEMTDAKEMWDAIKSRFGGNDESKKMQKYILKQQFEGFSVSNTEGLPKVMDMFPKSSKIKGTQDNRRRDAWNSGNKDGSRTGQKEDFLKKPWLTFDGERWHEIKHSLKVLMKCDAQFSYSSTNDTFGSGLDAPYHEGMNRLVEDECVSIPTKQQETPSFANQQVKTPRENVKSQYTHSQKPKVDKKDLGYGFAVRACFVCGSLNHLIRDCDFHEKRMARKADLNNGWNNVQRVNKQNQFVPSAVLTRTGIIPVNTARTSGTKNFSTARQSVNRQTVLTSTAMKVNTVKPNVNRVRPANLVLLGEKGKLLLSPQQVVVGDHKDTMVDPNTIVDPVLEIVQDYPHRALKNKGIVDSGCSRHMTGNKAYLAEFQDFNGARDRYSWQSPTASPYIRTSLDPLWIGVLMFCPELHPDMVEQLVQAWGRAAAMDLPWEDLKKLLMKENCPDDAIQKLEEEF
ncbi:hypothetical protein Tco_0497129 [Tanacetum coccineum]